MDVPVAPWSREVFGDHAEAVRAGVGQALRNMQANARASHEDTDAETKHAYGWSRYSGQFARIWDELKELPGARRVKPKQFQFALTMVGRGLLYPFRYAETASDVTLARVPSASLLVRELFSFAPVVEDPQHPLFYGEEDEGEPAAVALRAGLSDLPPDTCLVLVPFTCNVDGLLESYWGTAALGEERRLQWAQRPEQLHLPNQATRFHRSEAPPQTEILDTEAQKLEQIGETTSFDQGEEPSFDLSSRSEIDRKRWDRDSDKPGIPPQTEHEPEQPQANEDDEKK
ncbi:hypothetical protein ACFRKE_03310 [Kitasatospora indigofera]|uniref:hypothetical protein n=1 Tax=Kitasatospora indigofera TaxID=67307 RepID=UPI003673A1D4